MVAAVIGYLLGRLMVKADKLVTVVTKSGETE
jgi:hypothetical protein